MSATAGSCSRQVGTRRLQVALTCFVALLALRGFTMSYTDALATLTPTLWLVCKHETPLIRLFAECQSFFNTVFFSVMAVLLRTGHLHFS